MDWLAFKLSEAELLTESHEGRFLTMIVDEIDEIADELGTIEIARALIVAEMSEVLGEPEDGDMTLTALIAHAPIDMGSTLSELQSELLELANYLAATAKRGTAAAHSQKAAITTALNNLEPAMDGKSGYDQWGGRPAATPGATRFNQAL